MKFFNKVIFSWFL